MRQIQNRVHDVLGNLDRYGSPPSFPLFLSPGCPKRFGIHLFSFFRRNFRSLSRRKRRQLDRIGLCIHLFALEKAKKRKRKSRKKVGSRRKSCKTCENGTDEPSATESDRFSNRKTFLFEKRLRMDGILSLSINLEKTVNRTLIPKQL